MTSRLRGRYRRVRSAYAGQRIVQVCPEVPIISFTFDDFPSSAVRLGGRILKDHGALGTYFASLGLMGRELPAGLGFGADDLHQIIADGHELGCHTFGHCHSWETDPDQFEASILQNGQALDRLITGATFKTLSYPIASPRPETKHRAAKYFRCCRGGGETYNVGRVDANNLKAIFLEKQRDDQFAVEALIEANCEALGWLIFATHDIAESPTPFGCSPNFFENIVCSAVKSGATVLPVAQAWEAIMSSNHTF